MNGHYSYFVANTVHLPLNLKIVRIKPHQKPGEAGHTSALIGQRLADQSVNALGGLVAQLSQKRRASTLAR